MRESRSAGAGCSLPSTSTYNLRAAFEPQFYAEMLQGLGLADEDPKRRFGVGSWPQLQARVAARTVSSPA